MRHDTLVIIPAYNEEKYIREVIDRVKKCSPGADILVVDDGSADNTVRIAEEKGINVISHPYNLGDGSARQTGYMYALNEGYKYIVQIDGDGQHNPEHIPELLAPLLEGSADIAIGSRFLNRTGYKQSFARSAGMFIFNTIASVVTGMKITDSTSGYRAADRKVIEFYCDKNYYPTHYPDADLIILSHFAGFRIKEISVEMEPNPKAKPLHHGVKILFYIFKMLLSITVTLLRVKPKAVSKT
jgi:glycosyltransferase involved in cell wall biosynthesis